MIKYSLICDTDHDFEAWFKSGEAFGQQLESGLLSCPVCGSAQVRKALMAPRVRSTKGREPATAPAAEILPPAASEKAPQSPSNQMQVLAKAVEMKRHLLALRRAVEENCDYVGDRFAQKAREIHDAKEQGDHEEASKGIYGEATADEVEALKDDGIEIGQIPWIKQDA